MRIRFWNMLPGTILVLLITLPSWTDIQKGVEIPEDVLSLFSTSCYACHSTGSKSDKALKVVNFENWNEYGSVKKIAILDKIKGVVQESKMPPEKYLNQYPEKALSSEGSKKILEWTGTETEKLMK